MPSIKISKELNDQIYFLTFTVYRWYYIFDRYDRWDVLSKSLKFFLKEERLQLYSFVFMLNHIHLIIQSHDVAGFIRDFKKYTSYEMKRNISETEPHILKLFTGKDRSYHLWQKTNMPEIIESEWFYQQKENYIHNNPIKKNYVMSPEDWYWSSANEYCELKPNAEF